MMQITTLLTPATTKPGASDAPGFAVVGWKPDDNFRPTSTVERTVRAHDSVSRRNMAVTNLRPQSAKNPPGTQ